jgi:hypothetical protein
MFAEDRCSENRLRDMARCARLAFSEHYEPRYLPKVNDICFDDYMRSLPDETFKKVTLFATQFYRVHGDRLPADPFGPRYFLLMHNELALAKNEAHDDALRILAENASSIKPM